MLPIITAIIVRFKQNNNIGYCFLLFSTEALLQQPWSGSTDCKTPVPGYSKYFTNIRIVGSNSALGGRFREVQSNRNCVRCWACMSILRKSHWAVLETFCWGFGRLYMRQIVLKWAAHVIELSAAIWSRYWVVPDDVEQGQDIKMEPSLYGELSKQEMQCRDGRTMAEFEEAS